MSWPPTRRAASFRPTCSSSRPARWTPLLNEQLGCRVPIQPGKGYSLTMPRPPACPKIPLIFPETRVAVTPFQSGYRLGSTMEFAGYDESIRPERLQLLKDGATGYLHEPYCEPVLEEWFGWRPMTYDSLPIIDRSPKYENVIIAAGHNMLGLSMAPATGKLVAELAAGHSAPRRSGALSRGPVLIDLKNWLKPVDSRCSTSSHSRVTTHGAEEAPTG